MVRSSGPRIRRIDGSAASRSRSCSGTGCIISRSPASSAATRVWSEPIGVNTASVMLCSALPHQPGLGTSTVRTPGSRDFTMKGPVPSALRVAKFSIFLATLDGAVAPFCSAQRFDMISQLVISCGRIGFGAPVTNSTVRSSSLRTCLTEATRLASSEPSMVTR
jgi:hypothetical protein